MIARALVGRPKMILADNPLEGLDGTSQEQFLYLCTKLAKIGYAVVMTSSVPLPLEIKSLRVINLGGKLVITVNVRAVRSLEQDKKSLLGCRGTLLVGILPLAHMSLIFISFCENHRTMTGDEISVLWSRVPRRKMQRNS